MNENLSVYNILLANLTYGLRIFGACIIISETIYLLYQNKHAFLRETFVNLISGIVAVITQMFVKAYIIFDLHLRVYNNASLFKMEVGWRTFAIGFFMFTFIQYATHYFYHKVRIFWCLHEVHHSAIHMNATTGIRTSIFDVISLDIFYLLMPLLGIHPIVYLLLYTASKFWGTVIHVNEKIINKIPLLENVITTPSNHHIHHARNPQYIDKNFGEVVPWYDMLFKTYAKENETPLYGTLYVHNEISFWESQTHEFKRLHNDIKNANTLKNKIKYYFKPPGWYPN
jgi:sterol desaturase/sphingolipid hydroxylase (fatty acid hydroxylase superfamily)